MIDGRRFRVERTSVLGKRKRLIRLPDAMSGEELRVINTVLVAVGGRWSSWRKGFVFDADPTAAIAEITADAPPPSPGAPGCHDQLARTVVADYSGIPMTTAPLRVLVPETDDGALVRAVLDFGGVHISVTTTAPKHRPRSSLPTDPRLRVHPGTLTALLDTRPAPFDAAVAVVANATPSSALVQQLWGHLVPGGRLTILILGASLAEHGQLSAMAVRYGAHRQLHLPGGAGPDRASVAWMIRPGRHSTRVTDNGSGSRG
jgi:hypothetical protein